MFLKGTVIALALAGTALVTVGTASAAGIFLGSGPNRGGAVISIGFGDVAFGYRDGYWDNDHRWHRWSNDRDYRNYRNHHGSNYHDWNHDRDSNGGWLRN
jgi:hypothetical protein